LIGGKEGEKIVEGRVAEVDTRFCHKGLKLMKGDIEDRPLRVTIFQTGVDWQEIK